MPLFLALEFVESIDDVVFGLCKRGFFGHVLRDATQSKVRIICRKDHEQKKFKLWVNRFIRMIYFVNMGLLLIGLTMLMIKQDSGDYRCRSFSVQFGDDTWDDAWIELENGKIVKRLLVYSHFNGVYVGKNTPVIGSYSWRIVPMITHNFFNIRIPEDGKHDGTQQLKK